MREEYGIDVTKSTAKTERTVIDTGTGKSRKGYWRSHWRYAHLAPEHLRTAGRRLEGLTSIEPTKVLAQELAQEPVETEGAPQK